MRWLMLALLILLPAPALAFTCTPSGCSFEADYTEPTTNANGGPVNLTGTTVYYSINGKPEVKVSVAASGILGGGAIKQPITDATLLPGFAYTISAQATATNPAGEGVRTPAVTLSVDRSKEVPPAADTGLSLK